MQHHVLLAYNACMMKKHVKGLLWLLMSNVTLGLWLLLVIHLCTLEAGCGQRQRGQHFVP